MPGAPWEGLPSANQLMLTEHAALWSNTHGQKLSRCCCCWCSHASTGCCPAACSTLPVNHAAGVCHFSSASRLINDICAGPGTLVAWLSQCSTQPKPSPWDKEAVTHTLRAALCLVALLADNSAAKQALLTASLKPPAMDVMAQTLQNLCHSLPSGEQVLPSSSVHSHTCGEKQLPG